MVQFHEVSSGKVVKPVAVESSWPFSEAETGSLF